MVPIDHSLLYVEPVYLVAEQNELPQLKRVIVAHGDRVAMEPTLERALAALFGAPARRAGGGAAGPALLSAIRGWLAEAEAALARGDWAAFGAAMEALKRIAEPAGEVDPDDAGDVRRAVPADPMAPAGRGARSPTGSDHAATHCTRAIPGIALISLRFIFNNSW